MKYLNTGIPMGKVPLPMVRHTGICAAYIYAHLAYSVENLRKRFNDDRINSLPLRVKNLSEYLGISPAELERDLKLLLEKGYIKFSEFLITPQPLNLQGLPDVSLDQCTVQDLVLDGKLEKLF